MRTVIDANLLAAVVLPLPYSELATEKLMAWTRAGGQLLAPLLLEYEVLAILRKAIVAQWLTTELAVEAMRSILALHMRCLPPSVDLHARALYWAQRLGHSKTYDAHYLAVAEQEGVELWTADRRLAHSAQDAGASWVRWIGEVTVPK